MRVYKTIFLLSLFIQAVSATVSFRTVDEFAANYITEATICGTLALFIVLAIEVLLRVFSEGVIKGATPTLKGVSGFFGAVILFLSMYLSYVSPAKIATSNLKPIPYQKLPAEMLGVQANINSDKNLLVELEARKNGVGRTEWQANTKEELAQMDEINKRISLNSAILDKAFQRLNTSNDSIQSLNSATFKGTEEAHNRFGFLIQILYLCTIVALYLLDNDPAKFAVETPRSSPAKSAPAKSCDGETVEVQQVGSKYFEGVSREADAVEVEGNDGQFVGIDPATKARVIELTGAGVSRAEIKAETNIKSDSTITRIRQEAFAEHCNNAKVPIVDKSGLARAFGLDPARYTNLDKLIDEYKTISIDT